MRRQMTMPNIMGFTLIVLLLLACAISTPTFTSLPASTPTPTSPSFELTTFPVLASDLAFDGKNLWAAGGDLVKLDLNGFVLGRFSAPQANSVAFDGENIWVTLAGAGGQVLKYAPDGTRLGLFEVGKNPQDVLFDGEFIWIANMWDPWVTKLALDGTVIGRYSGWAERGYYQWVNLVFDGEYIWLASSRWEIVTKLSRDGQTVRAFRVGAEGSGGHGSIAFDGESIWVTGPGQGVTKLALDGSVTETYDVVGYPYVLLFGGDSMWVGLDIFQIWLEQHWTDPFDFPDIPHDIDRARVIKLALDGTELGRYPVEGWPQLLAFDGMSIWMANGRIQRLTLIKD